MPRTMFKKVSSFYFNSRRVLRDALVQGIVLDGVARMRERPIADLIDGLVQVRERRGRAEKGRCELVLNKWRADSWV